MKYLIFLFLLFHSQLFSQEKQNFNFGFEENKTNSELSDGWFKWGNYDLSVDSDSHSGKYSGKITSKEPVSFGSIVYRIPANYSGKKIRVEGFMKTKDVKGSHAGLLLRVDTEETSVVFDNMKAQAIIGTNDWKKYSIELDYPEEEAKMIYVAGILVGSGEAWFDDFQVFIDNKQISELKHAERKMTTSDLDREFEKGSGISIGDLNEQKIKDLELLGKIWGFLKYHHPEVAIGNYNWDYELFRMLPDYLKTNSTKERDEVLMNWIDKLGKVKESKPKEISKDAYLKPDLTFLDDLNSNLKLKLEWIYNNRHQGKNVYVKPGDVEQGNFSGEKSYQNLNYPDDGFRLLSLYRYWNIIQYYFPNKYLTDKDWNTILKEYITVFVEAKNELEYELACLQLIGEIQDTHANIWGDSGNKIQEWFGKNAPALKVEFIENKLVVVDYYNPEFKEKTGMEIGDIITKVNGKKVESYVSENTKYFPASNQSARLRDMAEKILHSNENPLEIEFIKHQQLQTTTIPLFPSDSLNTYFRYKIPTDKSYKVLDQNIGYITLANIQLVDLPELKKELLNTKGIIIDIRNYPNSFVPYQLGSYFTSTPKPFVKFTKPSFKNPGEFVFTKEINIPTEKVNYPNKVVILINDITQSQAEFTTMAFQTADNVTVIGSQTAGADGNFTGISLPGGIQTGISGIGVYYPDGRQTQRIGIVPDIEVHQTIEGIKKGKDELLEKAIELILNDK